MSDICTSRRSGGTIPSDGGNAVAFGAADWLHPAAAPAFAIMALLMVIPGVPGGEQMTMMCAGAQDTSPLGGMILMYVLMTIFHSAPWLKLISSRRAVLRLRRTDRR